MDFPVYIHTISMDLSILYFKGAQVKISLYFELEDCFYLANSADHDLAFHLGLQYLQKYSE